MHIEFVALLSLATCVLLVLQRGKAIKADDDANSGLLFREKAVQEGESIQCECAVDGLPPYYYYKYSNRTGLTFLRRSNQEYLLIDNISADYHNTFVCCQSRSMKLLLTAMICYHMNVTFKPQVYSKALVLWKIPLSSTYGESVRLICPLDGNPQPSYTWYFKNENKEKNDSFLVINEEYRLSHNIFPQNSSHNRQLLIDSVLEEDNGNYLCFAENKLGAKNYTFELSVRKCESFSPAHPSVTIKAHHHSVTAHVGDNITIDCEVASIPHAPDYLIVWYKNDGQLSRFISARVHSILQEFSKINCSQTSTLIIYNATLNDSANYSCAVPISDYPAVVDTISLNVSLPPKQTAALYSYRLLIVKVGIPLIMIVILSGVSITLAVLYYQRKRQKRLHQALEQYKRRPLPKKGNYKYEFFLAMTEEDEDKLKVDKLYMSLKKSFSIYYQLDHYLPGRTKVEMVNEGIRNSRFIILLLTQAYLYHKNDISQLELIYAMNRLEREFTKCVFIVLLEDKLHIPYKLRHITRFSARCAEKNLQRLASSPNEFGPDFSDYIISSDEEDQIEKESGSTRAIELLNLLAPTD